MERSAFFNSVNNDRVYNAQSFAEYFASFIANGVFPNPSNNLQVFAYDGFQLKVSPGKAWINGYFYVNDDDLYITLDLPDAVLSRIDAVVLRYSLADRNIKVAVKKGAFSSSPTPPALQRDASIYELCLAQVYVAAGATSITQADITDTRLSTELCGIVHAVVDQVDTQTLWEQYESEFYTWFYGIQDILDESTAGNLLNMIESHINAAAPHSGHETPAGAQAKANQAEANAKAYTDQEIAKHKNESTQNAHLAKNIGIEGTAGNFTATDVEGALAELFQSVSDGKNQLETAITDKGGTVSKTGNVATFDELDNGIRSIPVGDYAVGDTIRDSVLRSLPGGMGVEIWSKTDVLRGQGIAVDSVGNVYVAHYVSSGKAVRKLDSAGNEIWSKTDVPYGRGIAVDSAGNVYVAHYVSSGKAVRKLDSAGNEIWSKTDVPNGYGIAVDSAGNVYVTHDVSTGEKAVRKLDQAGNEIWSKTDVPNGYGIAVDSAGNVYVTHDVSTGEKAVRKLDQAGNEIWSKTDVPYGRGIAVDSVGNVYVAHYVSSGEKAVRKLDSAGNEIWSKTDVLRGRGIAVDSVGNVYVAHYVSTGEDVRKLDSAGNEIWSKTDVPYGYGIAVDSAGNVYVAHYVSTGEKAVRKLDGNKYFQIVG